MADTSRSPSSPNISLPVQRPTEQTQWDPSRGTANGHAHTPEFDAFVLSEQTPASVFPRGRQALAGISIRAFALGLTLGICINSTILLAVYDSSLWRAPFFLLVLSIFHFLEFWTTAAYNTPSATVDAFLLTSNGSAYNAAHTSALLETLVMHSFFSYPSLIPDRFQKYVVAAGMMLLLVGQVTRSVAMAQAGTNFNHTVQQKRARGHSLVTTGLYSVLRHPSYFGFFWWGLGSQIVLGNVICLVGYAIVLWRFFSLRIKAEENLLVKFFGEDYVQYRKRTYVGIPFIR